MFVADGETLTMIAAECRISVADAHIPIDGNRCRQRATRGQPHRGESASLGAGVLDLGLVRGQRDLFGDGGGGAVGQVLGVGVDGVGG